MFENGDYCRFQDLPEVVRGTDTSGAGRIVSGTTPKRFGGCPPAVELFDRWLHVTYDFSKPSLEEEWVDNPAAPTETAAGTDWQHTQFNASTITIVRNTFPAYLQLATGATAADGGQMQASVGTRTMFDTSLCEDMMFSATVKFTDANNDDDTVEQSRWFMGFSAVDTSILTAVDDYIGFAKADGTGAVQLVADATSGAPDTGASTTASLINLNSSNHNLINKWVTFTFQARNLNRTAGTGVVHAFIDYHRKPTGSQHPSSTYVGSIDLSTNSDVPGAVMCPSIAFITGEAVAKNLLIAKVQLAAKYELG